MMKVLFSYFKRKIKPRVPNMGNPEHDQKADRSITTVEPALRDHSGEILKVVPYSRQSFNKGVPTIISVVGCRHRGLLIKAFQPSFLW